MFRSVFFRFVVPASAILMIALGAIPACTNLGSLVTNAGPWGAVDAGDTTQGDLVVTLADGKVQGELVGGVRRFLRIPFAKPPTGSLRWRAPVKNDPWTGVRYETVFADQCPQVASIQNSGSPNEDCLYVNVWAPEPTPTGAPVMVWTHGGGNFAGSASDKLPVVGLTTGQQPLWYNGQFFAGKHGIVVVTINYRLGPMGFFAHPGLAAEGSPLGNQGLLDQRLALQWVHDNIASFGGDPGNVTLFGESSGAADVGYQVASAGSRGLFQRAISESGGCTVPFTAKTDHTPAEVAAAITAFGESVGCPGGPTQLNCLRHMSVADILSKSNQPQPIEGSGFGNYLFVPVIDGPGGFLVDQLKNLYDQGSIAKVPYLLGANSDEGTLFILSGPFPLTEKEYETELTNRYGAQYLQKLLQLYPASKFGFNYHAALARAISDQTNICGTHDTARRAAKAGLSVYMYNFNVPWNIVSSAYPAFIGDVAKSLVGVAHSSEIAFVFDSPYNPSSSDIVVADTMNTFWATFAKTGNPNYSGAPATWPAFAPDANDNDKRLQLDKNWDVLTNFRKEECAFWRTYYAAP